MTNYRTAVLLLALAALSQAHDPEAHNAADHKLLNPSDDPTRAATVVIGVIVTTTLSVLILLIPTMVYYKMRETQEDEVIPIKT